MSDTSNGNGGLRADAERWRTLMTIIVIMGAAAAVFLAGVNWGRVNATAEAVVELKASAVMKDGKEMAELRVKLDLINQQLSTLLNKTEPIR